MKSLVTCLLLFIIFSGHESSMSMTTVEDIIRSLNSKVAVMENEIEKLRSGLTDCKNSITLHKEKRLQTTITVKVAFTAQLTHPITNLGSDQAIIFDQKITDFGNNYDNSDGIFTAPVSGYYVFTWTFGVIGDQNLATALVVHGRKISYSVNNGADNDGGQVSNTVVVQVNKNDHVMIQTAMVSQGYDYKTIGEERANTFSGWLLFETS